MIADAAVRQYSHYLDEAHRPGHWTPADADATAELVAAQARQLHWRLQTMDMIEALAAAESGTQEDRENLRRALDLPLTLDHLDTLSAAEKRERTGRPALAEILSTLVWQARSQQQQERAAALLKVIPDLVIADIEARHFARSARVSALDTLFDQFRAMPLEAAAAQMNLVAEELTSGQVDAKTLRRERHRRAALHRDVAMALQVPQSQLTVSYLENEQERLLTTADLSEQMAADLIGRYLRQRSRTAAIDQYLQTEGRHQQLRGYVDRLQALAQQRTDAPDPAARASTDEQIRTVLDEITARFAPDGTAAPDRPRHDGVPNCVPTAANRLIRLRQRRGKLPESWPLMAEITDSGLAGTSELVTAEAVDADWEEVPALERLYWEIKKNHGAALGAVVSRYGGHTFEMEYEGSQMVVHEWVDGEERIIRGDTNVWRWVLARKKVALRVHAIRVDENGDAAVPYVANDPSTITDDRLSVSDARPDVPLAGMPMFSRDDLGPQNPNIERDIRNQAVLREKLELLGTQYGSQHLRELGTVDRLREQTARYAEDRGLGPVRLLEFNQQDDDIDRGRVVFEYGDTATAATVIGVVVDNTTEVGPLYQQAEMMLDLQAAAQPPGSVALVVMFRHDDTTGVRGRAPHTDDLVAADAGVLFRELEQVRQLRRDTPPRFELVGYGDGVEVTRGAQEMLAEAVAAARELPAVEPIPSIFSVPNIEFPVPPHQPLAPAAQTAADELRREFERFGLTPSDVMRLWQEAGQTDLLIAGAAEFVAELDGVAESDRERALLQWFAAVLAEPRGRVDALRLAALRRSLDITTGVVEGFGLRLHPMALPLRASSGSRTFLLAGEQETLLTEITVFVTDTPPTPEILRADALGTFERAIVQMLGAPHAVGLWHGTDSGQLAGDLARLAMAYPGMTIRLAPASEDGADARLIHEALEDEWLGDSAGRFEIGEGEVTADPSVPEVPSSARIDPVMPREQVLPQLLNDPDVADQAAALWHDMFGDATVVRATDLAPKWTALSREDRWLLARGLPWRIAEQPGIPARWRNRANRMILAQELAALEWELAVWEQDGDPDPQLRARWLQLKNRVMQLRGAEQMAAQLPGHPPVHVLSLGLGAGPGTDGNFGTGEAVVTFGDVDIAERVKLTVGGQVDPDNEQQLLRVLEHAGSIFVPGQASVAYLSSFDPSVVESRRRRAACWRATSPG